MHNFHYFDTIPINLTFTVRLCGIVVNYASFDHFWVQHERAFMSLKIDFYIYFPIIRFVSTRRHSLRLDIKKHLLDRHRQKSYWSSSTWRQLPEDFDFIKCNKAKSYRCASSDWVRHGCSITYLWRLCLSYFEELETFRV